MKVPDLSLSRPGAGEEGEDTDSPTRKLITARIYESLSQASVF